MFVPIEPSSSTGSTRTEARFVCCTGSDGVFIVSRITAAAAETAKVRDRKYIVRN